MPSPAAWQSAIVDAGFPASLDTDFDIDSFSGFLPCPIDGEMSGFEYYASTLSTEEAEALETAPGTDFSVQFCIGSRPLELVSALAASSALAAMTGGVLTDPNSGESVSGTNAILWAKARLS